MLCNGQIQFFDLSCCIIQTGVMTVLHQMFRNLVEEVDHQRCVLFQSHIPISLNIMIDYGITDHLILLEEYLKQNVLFK